MISIIIPVYNSEIYIKRAFDSLFNQSIGFNNLEVIFIDDASTDASPQIIGDYSNKYDNVKSFFLNKNSGAAGKPRNVGLSQATKDYIMFLDSDDYLMDNACEILYNEIIKENIDVVSGCLTWDGSNPLDGLWRAILTDPHDFFENRKKTTEEILNNDFPLLIDSIDDYESVIGDFGFVTKIYKRSLLENNSIDFPEGVIAEDSVFLLNVLLYARGIKYVNEIVYCYTHERNTGADLSMSNIHSKKILKGLLDSFFKMFYLSMEKNKSKIFKKYLLYQKLLYFLNSRLLKSNLSVSDTLELLIYAQPLFNSYGGFNKEIDNVLFKYIANKNYENALKVIFGKDIKKENEINYNSFEKGLDLFIFNPEDDLNEELLNHCIDNDIPTVFLDYGNTSEIKNKFDYVVDANLEFKQILDEINFNYIPYLRHIVFFYQLNDLKELTKIQNHFHSINYPYKHLKLITGEDNLFLSNTILKSDLDKFEFEDNYYFCFADLNFDSNSIEHDFDNPINDVTGYKNIIFSNSKFKEAVNSYSSIFKPKISVIIPMYNEEMYLHKCISSVLSQSYQNFEILCIDDCSSDSTVKIIEQYMDDSRIKLVRNKSNLGMGACRNIGLSRAGGDYVFFLDVHDWIDKNTFELLYDFLSKNELDMMLFKSILFLEESNRYILDDYYSMHPMDNWFMKIFNYNYLDKKSIFHIPPTLSNKIYSKDFLIKNDIKFSNNKIFHEDILFFFKCIIKAERISVFENYFHKKRKNNADDLKLINEQSSDYLKLSKMILNIFLEDISAYEYFKSELFNYIFENLKVTHDALDDKYKSDFLIHSQELFEEFAFVKGLFSDMINNLNKDLLDFFEIDFNNPNFLPIIFDEDSQSYNINKKYVDSKFLDNYNLILKSVDKIKKLGLFNKDFYEKNYNGALDSLLHYLFIGFRENKNPSEMFDGEFYTNFYDSVRASNLNPLVYLALYGLDNNEIKINKNIFVNKGINKKLIDDEINSFDDLGITVEKRSPKVIVTLTSFPERLVYLHYALYSLMNQSFKPDEIILWLGVEEFPNNENDIPETILSLKDNGLTIKWCEDIKSYKKIIPALNEYPNDILVTADDDIFYPKDWLKNLYEGHLKHPNEIICCRCHKVVLNSDNTFAPFKDWELVENGLDPSYLIFSTSGSGALYPPDSLYCDVTNKELFQKLCYWNDDMWLWAMSILNKTKTKLIDDTMNRLDCVNPAKESEITNEKVLWNYNKKGAYDINLENIIKAYPKILEIILKDANKTV